MKSGIYIILHLSSGKHYVGSSHNTASRHRTHWSSLARNKHANIKLQRAWNKYGEKDFRFDHVETCSVELLKEREQFYIDETKPFYNILRTAYSSRGYKMSEVARAKISASARANMAKLTPEELRGRNAASGFNMKGKKQTEHAKALISAAMKGRPVTEAMAAGLRAAHTKEAILKRANAISKNYIVTSPDGRSMKVRNLAAFCRENDLRQGHLSAVARGERKHHKGWSCSLDPN